MLTCTPDLQGSFLLSGQCPGRVTRFRVGSAPRRWQGGAARRAPRPQQRLCPAQRGGMCFAWKYRAVASVRSLSGRVWMVGQADLCSTILTSPSPQQLCQDVGIGTCQLFGHLQTFAPASCSRGRAPCARPCTWLHAGSDVPKPHSIGQGQERASGQASDALSQGLARSSLPGLAPGWSPPCFMPGRSYGQSQLPLAAGRRSQPTGAAGHSVLVHTASHLSHWPGVVIRSRWYPRPCRYIEQQWPPGESLADLRRVIAHPCIKP